MLTTDGIQFEFANSRLIVVPTIECAHVTRYRLLKIVQEGLIASHQIWNQRCQNGHQWSRQPVDGAVNIISNVDRFYSHCQQVETALVKSRNTCADCKQAYLARHITSNTAPVSPPHASTSMDWSSTDPSVTDSTSQTTDNDSDEEEDVDEDDGSDEEEEVDEDAPGRAKRTLSTALRKFKCMKGARNREHMRLQAPRIGSSAFMLPAQAFTPLPYYNNFDDYLTGPTLEDMRWLERSDGRDGDSLYWNSQPNIRSPWELFKDYGYRLEPNFALMFNNDWPTWVEEHILPTGRSPSPSPSTPTFDTCTMAMSEMLQEADIGTRRGLQMFVQGMTQVDDFIVLDMEMDSYALEPEDVQFSMDLDSIIWVTHRLKVKTEIAVHVLPYAARVPPISKNNHIYIELLMPPSESDRRSGTRNEWFTTRHALSSIPHSHFAKIGEGSGSCNISVFWPRMKHRNHLTGKWATLVPTEVQRTWLTEVVYKAIVDCADPAMMPYVDLNFEDWLWKTSNKRQPYKTTPIDAKKLSRLQDTMKRIIKNNPGEFDMFGSFFFVVDLRGIKRSTSVNIGDGNSPYDELKKKYRSLDWNYMMDRRNGQLFMDLGMGFHPNPDDGEPLIGLWRLDKVQASYAAAGMKKPVTHPINTLSNYGAVQGEMTLQRAAIVQLCFRSSYNLCFEIVRRPGEEDYFCQDSDAYDNNSTFGDCIKQYDRMFIGAVGKSYGVREEMRGSGRAIVQVLDTIPELVSGDIFITEQLCQRITITDA
jgi:hypothetical protein